jgi:glucose-1-phosphate adenylyltransferase
MKQRVVGLVVTGGRGPLRDLAADEDAALTPFAGKYRFVDLALATLVNSTIDAVYVAASRPSPRLRTHLAAAVRPLAAVRRPFPVLPHGAADVAASRAARALRAAIGCGHLVRNHAADTVIVLTADHVLQIDARRLLAAHRAVRADVTLCALPLARADMTDRTVLDAVDGRVCGIGTGPTGFGTGPGVGLAWTGDLVIAASALPALATLVPAERDADDAAMLAPLVRALRVAARDPSDGDRRRAFWHDPTSVEAYYDTQMNLCTPRPAFDLHDPAWPLRAAASGSGPAKVVADGAGRPGQTLNALVSDGVLVRGGVVVNTVLGHGVVVESGAEVEDAVLFDGCRIGRGARVRRAVVGAGAVIGDAGEIGFGRSPASPARVLPSGLTLVPAGPPTLDERSLAAAGV